MYFRYILKFFVKTLVAVVLIDRHKSVLLIKIGINIA